MGAKGEASILGGFHSLFFTQFLLPNSVLLSGHVTATHFLSYKPPSILPPLASIFILSLTLSSPVVIFFFFFFFLTKPQDYKLVNGL